MGGLWKRAEVNDTAVGIKMNVLCIKCHCGKKRHGCQTCRCESISVTESEFPRKRASQRRSKTDSTKHETAKKRKISRVLMSNGDGLKNGYVYLCLFLLKTLR